MKSIGELSIFSKAQDLQLALEEERTQDFYFKVKELTSRLPKLGRCTICTLKIPCKHFSSPEEQRVQTPEIESSSQLLSLVGGLKSSTHPLPQELQKERSFSVRFRGPETRTVKVKQERNCSLPNSKKLMVLEQIEAYREEKIKKEIERVRKEREDEFKRLMDDKAKNEKRKKHADELRMRIEQYKDTYLMKKEQVRIMMEDQRKKRCEEEDKRKAYLNKRKEELNVYRNKKIMMEQISRQKMIELQQDFHEQNN
jgi:hypothetical protein